MNVADIPRSLAIVLGLQITLCVYVVLGVSCFIKIHDAGGGYYLPCSDLSLWLKYHGWLLLGLPLLWYWLHVRDWLKSGADVLFLGRVLLSGIVVLVLLFALGLAGTIGTMRTHLIHSV
jgi:hypothetical protein